MSFTDLAAGACRNYSPPAGEPWPWETDVLTGKGAKLRMTQREGRAKTICAACPVREPCKEYGILQGIEYGIVEGIWGGLTPAELAAELGVKLRFSSGIPVFDDRQPCG
jgi:hypothetical protein